MNFQENTVQIFSDYFNGLLSYAEEKELVEWISKSKENTALFAEYSARWELSVTAFPAKEFNREKIRKKIQYRINPGLIRKNILMQSTRVAAMLVLALITGFLAYQYSNIQNIRKSELLWIQNETPLGNKSTVVLPDGSLVWLNAGSKIKYSTAFNLESRTMFLEGEAYFQVKSNYKKPFVVNTSCISIQATGTTFNVRAYSDENFIETTLVEGRVTVKNPGAAKNEAVEMKPSQKLTIYKSEEIAAVQKKKEDAQEEKKILEPKVQIKEVKISSNVETAIYTSWKDNEWIINKENFSSLAVKMERRYDVKIIINDERIKDFAYTGKLKDETLEQVMNVICQTSPINYKVDGKNVRVWFNEKYNKK